MFGRRTGAQADNHAVLHVIGGCKRRGLVDARRGLNTRMPGTDDGVGVTGPREISLAGIVYRGAKEWTIWLNDLRVSPTAIPDEVLDLKVHKDYIELEWFDSSTNQIFPIRLRAHQRFNLDTRMFLPG